MEFIVKRTTELTESQIGQICALFAEVFEGNTKDTATFREQYLNTVWGYSLHALMIDQGRIVGANMFIPVNYTMDDRQMTWLVSGDSMVKKQYRNFIDFIDLVELCYDTARNDYKVAFLFGFPNDNSHQVCIKGLGNKDIAQLHTYVLPYRVGGVKPQLRWLNPLSMFMSRILVLVSRLQLSNKPTVYLIDKDRTDFAETRLRWFGGEYQYGEASGCRFVYRIKLHEGVRTAFIIDMDHVSPRAVNDAVRHILRHNSHLIDLVMYVGLLPFRPMALIRLPRRFEPKSFWFVGKILDKNIDRDLVLNPNNWNVNLSCYDLI